MTQAYEIIEHRCDVVIVGAGLRAALGMASSEFSTASRSPTSLLEGESGKPLIQTLQVGSDTVCCIVEDSSPGIGAEHLTHFHH